MHHLTATIFSFLVLFSAEVMSNAMPEGHHDQSNGHKPRHRCLTADEAQGLITLWDAMFEVNDGGDRARNSVTDDFKYFSQSLNAVTPGWALPLDVPTWDGKDALVQASVEFATAFPQSNFTTVSWDYGCNTFTWRWNWELLPGALPIAGVDLMFVQKESYLFEKVYSEFDTALYLSENGCKFVSGLCGDKGCPVCDTSRD